MLLEDVSSRRLVVALALLCEALLVGTLLEDNQIVFLSVFALSTLFIVAHCSSFSYALVARRLR
jgi:hypothetical protein